jgi:hypothetical protein
MLDGIAQYYRTKNVRQNPPELLPRVDLSHSMKVLTRKQGGGTAQVIGISCYKEPTIKTAAGRADTRFSTGSFFQQEISNHENSG